MIELATLKNFDSDNHKAGVQLIGSLTTYLDHIKVARNIPSDEMIAGRRVIVAMPGGNPKDAVVIAVFTT